MPGPSDTKLKLLEATLELISEKGYLGATTREIAQRAGVSELTLFRKFEKKEKLFEEVLKTQTFLPLLRETVIEVEDLEPAEALEMIGIRYLQTLKERKMFVKIVLSELNTYPEKVRNIQMQFVREMEGTLQGYLEELQKSGKLRVVSLEAAARTFLRMLFSFFILEEIIKDQNISSKTLKKTVREVVDIFMYGIVSYPVTG
ncbi:MAG: TetR/AcrR family transcriptional regulator [bacterium]